MEFTVKGTKVVSPRTPTPVVLTKKPTGLEPIRVPVRGNGSNRYGPLRERNKAMDDARREAARLKREAEDAQPLRFTPMVKRNKRPKPQRYASRAGRRLSRMAKRDGRVR
jgi:hypothetical protein